MRHAIHTEDDKSGNPYFSELQDVLKSLSQKDPDECLSSIAGVLKVKLNCETVSILLWNEVTQELITEYKDGMPSSLPGPEKYKLNEGITGKYIFQPERRIRAIIHFDTKVVEDIETGEEITDKSIKWDNMERFKVSSIHSDFRSLLGAPLSIKKQKIGVVKLINKIDRETGRLAQDGFSREDLITLKYFLEVIEHVVETKRNEKQIKSLLRISQKITSAVFNYEEVLKEVSSSCADVFNYRICIVRLMDGDQLPIKACNLGTVLKDGYAADIDSSTLAAEEKLSIKWKETAFLESFDGTKSFGSYKKPRLVNDYKLKSLLIVPIIYQGRSIGTIECYTTLPHDFYEQEVDAIKTYASSLVIALMNSKQQSLLNGLIDLQRVGVASDPDANAEEQLIQLMLKQVAGSLGQDYMALGIIFSKSRLMSTKLLCKELYGIGQQDLKLILEEEEYRLIGGIRNNDYGPEPGFWDNSSDYTLERGRKTLHIHRTPISFTPGGASLGVLILGVGGVEEVNAFSRQIIDLSSKYLGVALENIDRFKKLVKLPKIIKTVSSKNTLEEIYKVILEATTQHFGFDYGAIARIDFYNREIRSESGISSKPHLVDPNKWQDQAHYKLKENDILVSVVNSKKAEIISGPEVCKKWDDRLNRDIFERFNHKDLIRIFVPFVYRKNKSSEQKEEAIVLGVIEAGYHINTQGFISPQQKELFEIFIDYSAESLQRVSLLRERADTENFLGKLKPESEPDAFLECLLKEAVEFLGANFGTLMFLTHYDERLTISDDPLTYNLSEEQRKQLIKSLEVHEGKERTGIVAYVAARNQSYLCNKVKEEPLYIEEFKEVESELAIPLRYSEKVIGVLDIYSYTENWFDPSKAALLETITDQAIALYQNARISKGVSALVNPFNLFSTIEGIYSTIIETIQGFLKTETVAIWEKKITKDGFYLELVHASQALQKGYEDSNISELPHDCFTAEAIKTGQIKEINYEQIKSSRFKNVEFAVKNNLKSMTSIPILTGQETYAVIDVFSRRDARFFSEEKRFLELLASKAAIAIQNAKWIKSFNAISEALADGDIDLILKTITESAVEVLQADPVILFRYESGQKRFLPDMIVSGSLIHPELRELKTGVKEGDLVTLILNRGTVYLENQGQYLEFQHGLKRRWEQNYFEEDFWRREKIESVAAVRLDHPSGIQGVMFFNYRTPRIFNDPTNNDPTKRLIEGFAAQAAAAIANAKLLELKRAFWEQQRRSSLALSVNEIVVGLVHNSGNLLDSIAINYLNFSRQLNKTNSNSVSKSVCENFLKLLQGPLKELVADFNRLRDYRNFNDFIEDTYKVEGLIDSSLLLLRKKLENLEVKKSYSKTPEVLCDRNQIQHVLLNLFINSYDAMVKKGKLHIETTVDDAGRYVIIKIKDNGSGITKENHSKIFEPFFTTKRGQGGTGLGLPISKYIVENHGGRIEFESSKAKGTTFSVYLPIDRGDKNVRSKNSGGR